MWRASRRSHHSAIGGRRSPYRRFSALRVFHYEIIGDCLICEVSNSALLHPAFHREPTGTSALSSGMEVGKTLYRNGEKVGAVVYSSPFSLRDSKNPLFAGATKASQLSLIVEAPNNFGVNHTADAWELGDDDRQKRSVKILGYHYTEGRAILAVELTGPQT